MPRSPGSCGDHHLELVVEQSTAAAPDLGEPLFPEVYRVRDRQKTLNRDGPWIHEVAQ